VVKDAVDPQSRLVDVESARGQPPTRLAMHLDAPGCTWSFKPRAPIIDAL
jgi:hypothetical protein